MGDHRPLRVSPSPGLYTLAGRAYQSFSYLILSLHTACVGGRLYIYLYSFMVFKKGRPLRAA